MNSKLTNKEATSCAFEVPVDSLLKQSSKQLPLGSLFKVTKCLGMGSQGAVYEATRLKTGKESPQELAELELPTTVALKVFSETLPTQYVQKEIEVHRKLSGHPNVVTLRAFSDKDATVVVPNSLAVPQGQSISTAVNNIVRYRSVMTMDQCPMDLFHFITRGGASHDLALVRHMVSDICQGVMALHREAGFAHLDLKLENVLIAHDGTLQLCDFGLSQPLVRENMHRVGTEQYMAPEVFRASSLQPFKGEQADIFSLGVILFTLCFGISPFCSTSEDDRNYKMLHKNPQFFWEHHPGVKNLSQPVSEELKTTLTQMLSKDLSVRPQSIEEIFQLPFFQQQDGQGEACQIGLPSKEELQARLVERLDQIVTLSKQED